MATGIKPGWLKYDEKMKVQIEARFYSKYPIKKTL